MNVDNNTFHVYKIRMLHMCYHVPTMHLVTYIMSIHLIESLHDDEGFLRLETTFCKMYQDITLKVVALRYNTCYVSKTWANNVASGVYFLFSLFFTIQ